MTMTQLELFDEPAGLREVLRNYRDVPGLTYCPQFLPSEEQGQVLAAVDGRPWRNDLKRRVQHYGYRYDYKARSVDPSMYVGPLPPFAVDVARRLLDQGLVEEMPDQLIVNEYRPGQGITAHIDCEPCFKNTIVTVSLGWAYEMDFISLATGEALKPPPLLEPGSVLVLQDEARFQWTHGIKARKRDRGVPRKRRVSLTFRNVILVTETTALPPAALPSSGLAHF
jgi:alkylated DNA repair dioxygenase AlkB